MCGAKQPIAAEAPSATWIPRTAQCPQAQCPPERGGEVPNRAWWVGKCLQSTKGLLPVTVTATVLDGANSTHAVQILHSILGFGSDATDETTEFYTACRADAPPLLCHSQIHLD